MTKPMDTGLLCFRRPSQVKTTIGRLGKPPYIRSMAFDMVNHDLRQARYKLSIEKMRSLENFEAIEDLRKKINCIRGEKRKALEECENAKQAVRKLSQRIRRIQNQLEDARAQNNQEKMYTSKLECLYRSVCVLDNSSTSLTRNSEKLRQKLRDITVFFGVLHCDLSESRAKDSDLQETNKVLGNISNEMKMMRQENLWLRRQHELDVERINQKSIEKNRLEMELKKTESMNEALSVKISEQKAVNDGMKKMLNQFQEEQEKYKGQMVILLKKIESKNEEADRINKQLEEVKQSNQTLEVKISESEEKLKGVSSSLESRVRGEWAHIAQSKVCELLLGMKALREAYQQASKTLMETRGHGNDRSWILDARAKLQSSMELRRIIFGKIQNIRGTVRVYCRMRPPKGKRKEQSFIEIPQATAGSNWKMICRDECFSFDRVFGPSTANKEVYEETAGVVETVLDGSNVCILAYGQTGSGKSYTMEGVRDDPGVNILALKHLFSLINGQSDSSTVVVNLSIMEIYNDEIQDLLVESDRKGCDEGYIVNRNGDKSRQGPSERKKTKKLQIRKVHQNSEKVHVPGIIKLRVSNVGDVNRIMGRARRRRTVSSTRMNAESSRSHLIVQVEVERQKKTTMLHLVDLAGSERVERSQVSGERLKEAIHINKSLSTLGNVLSALEHRREHVPYRDTKLSYLLSSSIGGNAKTLMFITVSGEREDKMETWATLEFGKRIGKIVLQEGDSQEKIDTLRRLEEELREAEEEIEKTQNLINGQ